MDIQSSEPRSRAMRTSTAVQCWQQCQIVRWPSCILIASVSSTARAAPRSPQCWSRTSSGVPELGSSLHQVPSRPLGSCCLSSLATAQPQWGATAETRCQRRSLLAHLERGEAGFGWKMKFPGTDARTIPQNGLHPWRTTCPFSHPTFLPWCISVNRLQI
jgi:hypothetical protein